jgi:polar amino acid transport system substrate-binding protein
VNDLLQRLQAILKKRRWIPFLAAVLALGAVAAIAFWPRSRHEDAAWERIQTTGVLRVGVDASYPPFEDVGPEGELVGYDIDLANEIGRRLGVEVTFANMGYDGLFDAALVGEVDVLISALVAGPEQLGRVEYTTPYFNAGEVLVVPQESPIQTMEDLEGLTLAVEYGSGGDIEARAWERRLASLTIIRHEDPNAAIEAVINEETDAALVDGVTARLAVGAHHDLRLGDYVTEYLFAAAVAPDSNALHRELDATIWDIIHDGTLTEITRRWFGETSD